MGPSSTHLDLACFKCFPAGPRPFTTAYTCDECPSGADVCSGGLLFWSTPHQRLMGDSYESEVEVQCDIYPVIPPPSSAVCLDVIIAQEPYIATALMFFDLLVWRFWLFIKGGFTPTADVQVCVSQEVVLAQQGSTFIIPTENIPLRMWTCVKAVTNFTRLGLILAA